MKSFVFLGLIALMVAASSGTTFADGSDPVQAPLRPDAVVQAP